MKVRNVHVGADDALRCAVIASHLDNILRHQANVDIVAAELPAGSQSSRAAKALGMAQAAVVATCVVLGFPLVWVTAQEAKVALVGKKNAEKADMVEAFEKRLRKIQFGCLDAKYGGENKQEKEAIADAFGVGLAAFNTEMARIALRRRLDG